jgi:hypothetical protein
VVRLFLPLTGAATREFVRAFPLMAQAYAQGAMAFGLFRGEKTRYWRSTSKRLTE